jgi:hypothetical protein
MPNLIHQRCFNHSVREAAARCPECGQFYCRECITEHDDRVICATCLAKVARQPLSTRPAFVAIIRTVQLFVGMLTACLFFYMVGRALLSIDTSVHEGTIWKGRWVDSE